MCIIYSESISLENRKKQLTNSYNEVIDNGKLEHFNDFNTTSVLFLLYSSTGMHGEECKSLSIPILRKFIEWIRNNKWELYLPESGLEAMFHSKVLEDVVDWCESYNYEESKNDVHSTPDNWPTESHFSNKAEAIRFENYKPLLNKLKEADDNLKKNDLVYYIKNIFK